MTKYPEYVEEGLKIIAEFEKETESKNILIGRLAYEIYTLRNELKKIKGEK